MMNFLLANRLSLATLLAMLVTSAALWSGLPEQVPAHFNLRGEADDYRSRELVALLVPMIFAALLVVVNYLVRISPQKFTVPGSKHAMDIVVFGVGILMLFVHIGLLVNSGDFNRLVAILGYGFAAFLIITGNVFGEIERNFFLGVRTPWTLASDANWKATHRFAGRLMVGAGCLLLPINLIWVNIYVILGLGLAPLIAPIAYSALYYWRNEKGQSGTGT